MTTKIEVRNEIARMINDEIVPREIDESIAVMYGEDYRGEVYEYLEDKWVEEQK